MSIVGFELSWNMKSTKKPVYGTFCFLVIVYRQALKAGIAAPPSNSNKKLDKNRKVAETILRCLQDQFELVRLLYP